MPPDEIRRFDGIFGVSIKLNQDFLYIRK
jgi:hypothetical protein